MEAKAADDIREWMLILNQSGGGCGYTIGCGIATQYLGRMTRAQAIEAAKADFIGSGEECDGMEYSEITLGSLLLVEFDSKLPIEEWRDEKLDRIQAAHEDEEKKKELAELARLQAKYGEK